MKLPPEIVKELDGCNWCVSVGGRHLHVILDGRRVGILPRGKCDARRGSRATLNLRAQIRRAKRGEARTNGLG